MAFPRFAHTQVSHSLRSGTVARAVETVEKVDVQWGLFALVHNIGKILVFAALI
jgi:hypothetical protein